MYLPTDLTQTQHNLVLSNKMLFDFVSFRFTDVVASKEGGGDMEQAETTISRQGMKLKLQNRLQDREQTCES